MAEGPQSNQVAVSGRNGGPPGAGRRSVAGQLIELTLIVGAYVAAGKLGIGLEVASGVITPVWAPTGIALVAILILGYRAWPAIAFAAFVTNVTEGAEPAVAEAIAAGNTLEPIAGAWIFTTLLRGDRSLSRASDVLALIFGAALVSTTVSASVGTTALFLSDALASSYGSSWLLWWVGDAMGDVVIAPLLLAWIRADTPRYSRRQLLEGAALAVALVVASAFVFTGGRWQYPYLLFPLMLWCGFRFGLRGATASVFIVTAAAIAGIVGGGVAIEDATQRETAQILQTLLGVAGVSVMAFAAALDERTRAENEVRNSLDLYAAVLQSTADGILVVNRAGQIVTSNLQFAEMWGIPAEVLATQSDDRAIESVLDSLDDPETFLTRVRDLYASPEVESVDEVTLKDGRVFERYSRPYERANDGGRVWSFRDVTARRRAEQARQSFVTMASHELRNPLAVALGFLNLLADQWSRFGDDERHDVVTRARGQTKRISDLVEGLLTATTIESGNLRVRPQVITLADAVAAAVAEQSAGDTTRIDVPESARVVADPDHVHHIIGNFLGNADKYGRPPVSVTAVERGDRVELRVCDSGDGVPPDVRDRLFTRFARASAAIEAGIPGTGLGLAITRDLAQAQGGDVWYEDARAGACFCLALPRADTDEPRTDRRLRAAVEREAIRGDGGTEPSGL